MGIHEYEKTIDEKTCVPLDKIRAVASLFRVAEQNTDLDFSGLQLAGFGYILEDCVKEIDAAITLSLKN